MLNEERLCFLKISEHQLVLGSHVAERIRFAEGIRVLEVTAANPPPFPLPPTVRSLILTREVFMPQV